MTTTLSTDALVRLTEFARCAGCAAKMGPGDLSSALASLCELEDPRLLVGRETFDDAAVFLVAPGVAIVQTIDFFAPIVDDPYEFGQIAAANALSDVFAMGGEPLTAMNVVGFPTSKLPLSVLGDILRGGQEKVHEAGAVLVGGHTIIDDEIKYGLSVTGRADPARLLTNAGAMPDDVLLLTKPLGTGILATAAKRGTLPSATESRLLASMRMLNATASRAALAAGARCATDVTGFGLLGHASHIARASHVTLHIDARAVPLLPGVRDAWAEGSQTGGGERNAAYLESRVDWGAADVFTRSVLVDPQTSGGMLVALPRGGAKELQARVADAVEIGYVASRGEVDIVVR